MDDASIPDIRVLLIGGPENMSNVIIPGNVKTWSVAELVGVRPMRVASGKAEEVETRRHDYEVYPLFVDGLPKYTGVGIHADLCRTIRERR